MYETGTHGRGLSREDFEARARQLGYGQGGRVLAEDRDKFRAEAEAALCLACNLPTNHSRSELFGMSLMELARRSLEVARQSTRGSALDIIVRAATTSDFPAILANTSNKAMLEGFDNAPETWNQWCSTGTASNFRPGTIAQISGTSDLDQINEGTEYKYGRREDSKEEYLLATFGKIFAITRQAIINDDLGALKDVPMAHGEAAARKIGDIAYAILTTNGTMNDGNQLFHSEHNNIGTAASPGTSALAEGIKLMKTQQDAIGNRLNTRPLFFIAPIALEGSSEVFFNSQLYDDAAKDSTRVNPYSGDYFTRIYEARLDNNSATRWYLAGPPRKTVRVIFLDGQEKPSLEHRTGFYSDGLEYKVRIDACALAVDWRALVTNPGV